MTISPVSTRTAGWTADDSTFGARLALVRQRMQWGNVKEAAVACGLPTESWRTWERDGITPRRQVEIAKKIAEKTGCDYIWLALGPGFERGVVSTPTSGGQTTATTVEPAKRTSPIGQPKRAVPPASSRRPSRVVPFIAELMPDAPSADLLTAVAV